MDPLSITERCQVRNPATGLQCRKPAGHENIADRLHGPIPEELEALNKGMLAVLDLSPPRSPEPEPDDSNHPLPVIDPRQMGLFPLG